MPATVLVYGDSNAWGWIPDVERRPLERFPDGVPWPEAMAARLGGAARVRVDALPARTVDRDDTFAAETFPPLAPEAFNGRHHLPGALVRATPVDLVVLALGTNDMKARFARSAGAIAASVLALAAVAGTGGPASAYAPPDVLILAPPPLGPLAPWTRETFAGQEPLSRLVGPAVAAAAVGAGLRVAEAGAITGGTHGVDGVHYTEADHAALAEALATQVDAALAARRGPGMRGVAAPRDRA
ncbi:hydrolase [Roseospira navarrensis]|uniref:Hydrolase n=1 Tax=Roseospira navarrensis TaxID=140058 RepID=A0A7X1ZAU2_9PROT|nr:hydrolase [Roseospira navarrensis]MQX35156.1 hydrolase [Roseospira navarrensis]